MVIVCPFCQTRFLVAASLFAAGPRQMICAKCKHSWRADGSEDGSAPAHAQTSRASPVGSQSDPKTSNVLADAPPPLPDIPPAPIVAPWARKYLAYFFMGLAFLLLLIFIFDRYALAEKWGFLEPFYDIIGLHIYHMGEGLEIRSVRSELVYEDGIMKLVVEGKIGNRERKTLEIPAIRASAIGPDGQAMQDWQIDAPAAKVAPGEEIPFRSSINAPPGNIADINLNFVEINPNAAN